MEEIFKVAFASFKMSFNKNVDIQIEYLGPKKIGERRWNPRQLVDWLLECDVHIILTHLNQGRLSHSLILSHSTPCLTSIITHLTCNCGGTDVNNTYRQCLVSMRNSTTYFTALTLFDTGAYTSFVNRGVAK